MRIKNNRLKMLVFWKKEYYSEIVLALNLKCSVYSRFEWVYTVWVFSASGYLWCVEGKCNGKQDLALFLFKN